MSERKKKITRRRFLQSAGMATGAAALAACGTKEVEVTKLVKETVVEKETVIEEVQKLVTPTAKPMKAKLPEVIMGNVEGTIITTLDPQNHWAFMLYEFDKMVYDRLVERDVETGEFRPGLATEWEVIDPTTIRFNLRKGVKFHNGEEFTGESVKMTIERFTEQELIQSYRWRSLDTVEIEDDYTVTIKSTEPLGNLFSSLTVTSMLSPKARSEGGEDWFNNPVGTGMFRFDEWARPEGKLSVVHNPDYWGGPDFLQDRLGNCEKFTFMGIPEIGSRVSALLAKDIHIAGWLTPETVGVVTRDSDLAVRSYVGADQAYLGINFNVEPLAVREVRYAMSLAIDRQKITELISPLGQVAAGYIPPGVMGYNPDLQPDPYDPEQAKALLKEAGYGDGFEFDMHYKVGPWPKITENMLMLQDYWKEVGIQCNVILDEPGTFLTIRLEGDYGIYVSQYGNMPMDPSEHLGPRVAEDPFLGGFNDQEIIQGIHAAGAMLDQKERVQAYREVDKKLVDKGRGSWIVQFYPGYLYAFGHGVTGLELWPNSVHDYRTLRVETV